MKAIAWALTDIGKKRDHNEDSHLADEALALFAVADGMGGHQGGDRASRLAVEILREQVAGHTDFEAAAREILRADPLAAVFPRDLGAQSVELLPTPPLGQRRLPVVTRWGGAGSSDVSFDDDDTYEEMVEMPTDPSLVVVPPPAATILRAAARNAGRAIFDAAQHDPRLLGMGTTLTALMFDAAKARAHFVHVGDSRAFLIRDGQVTQITEDHSWIAEQVRAGIISEHEAKESKFRHIITRSVGFEREVDVDLLGLAVNAGDCFLLCSDGMSNHIGAEELARIVTTTYYAKVPQLLVDLANDRGGDDNITVVLVYTANEAAQ